MQASQGSLTIIDPHGAVKVFWNGAPVPAIDVSITNKFVQLVVPAQAVLPPGVDAQDNIKIRRQK